MSTPSSSLSVLESVVQPSQQQPSTQNQSTSLDVLNAVASGQQPPSPETAQEAKVRAARAALEASGAIPKSRHIDFSKAAPGVQHAMTSPIPAPIKYAIMAAPMLTGV